MLQTFTQGYDKFTHDNYENVKCFFFCNIFLQTELANYESKDLNLKKYGVPPITESKEDFFLNTINN